MMRSPLPQDLVGESRKCAKILSQFIKPGIPGKGLPTDQFIPHDIIHRARGIAVLTVIKAGFMWAGKAGSGLVIARLPNGSWSAPSAIGTGGMSFGGQIGAEVTDFVIILNTEDALKAFSHGGNVTLGGGLSVAVGPYGRTGEISATAKNLAAVYSYSKSKGLFAGISIEGSIIMQRKDANQKFYGRPISAKEILSGSIPFPAQANELANALAYYTSPLPANPTTEFPSTQSDPPGYPSYVPPGEHRAAEPQSTHSSAIPTYVGPNALPTPAASLASHAIAAPARPSVPSRPETVTALYDFTGQQTGDLSFKAGDIITVLRRGDTAEQWWLGRCHSKEGIFPANYCDLSHLKL